MKYVVGFGRFWWDFIVGDSVVLAIGGVGMLALAYLLVQAGDASVPQFILPLGVFAAVALSLPLRR
jgi:hypothetical protein